MLDKDLHSQIIARQIKEYLAQGKAIKRIPFGHSIAKEPRSLTARRYSPNFIEFNNKPFL
jgi:hypothetical protein|tara:strand:+ start:678 stop:857 length:180 start_codon:yes stop_codon:yes gene_type:complete